jgi:hypothetical protein
MQGNWTVSVLYKQPAALPQRFVIAGQGLLSGAGTYPETSGPVQVTSGPYFSWTVNIQAQDDTNGQWINSSMRTTQQRVENGMIVFEVESEDLIQDNTWNDLVLRFSKPAPPPPPPPPAPPPPPPVTPTTPPPPVVVPPPPPPPPIQPPASTPLAPGEVYQRIADEDKLPMQLIRETYGIWTDNVGNLLTFHTCSNAQVSSSYHRVVYNKQCASCGAAPQFDITYGHDGGSGSRDLGGLDALTPTNAVYGQYRSICLDPGQRRFTIGGRELEHIYVINVRRDRMGDRLDEGNVELNLHELNGRGYMLAGNAVEDYTEADVAITGSRVLRLIDDSKLKIASELSDLAFSGSYSELLATKTHLATSAGEVFYMVSGSLEAGIYSGSNPQVFGLLYPRLGVIVLDALKLDLSASFLTRTGSDENAANSYQLFTAISGAAQRSDESGDYMGFQARKMVHKYTEHYFIRVKNSKFNFTNNPSYVSGSEGDIKADFLGDPRVYITSIGLYNENKELLAIGKISRPIQKNYTSEGLFTIRLVY